MNLLLTVFVKMDGYIATVLDNEKVRPPDIE